MDKGILQQKYISENKSLRIIAKELGSSVSSVYKALVSFKIPLRDKSAAQKNHLKKSQHPRKGQKLSQQEKERISEGMAKYWDNLSPQEKDKKVQEIAASWHNTWKNYSAKQKQDILDRLILAQKPGQSSQLEEKIADELRKRNYIIEVRSKNYIPGEDFHVDIALPNDKFIIEIDGPMHFMPVFGPEKLKKALDLDERKNKILIAAGYSVIRIRDKGGKSQSKIRKIINFIEGSIHQGPTNKVLYLEV